MLELDELLKIFNGGKSLQMNEEAAEACNYYSQEADYAMTAAISKLEPTLLVFLAAFAGFIVLAIYMPMFTMYNLF